MISFKKKLLSDLHQFFPTNSLTREQKVNSIARFAIFYSILIIIFNQDLKWLSISILLLIISFCLGYSENFEQINKVSTCVRPTKNNPFMNWYFSSNGLCGYNLNTGVETQSSLLSPEPESGRHLWSGWLQSWNDGEIQGNGNWCGGRGGICEMRKFEIKPLRNEDRKGKLF